eukprot:3825389-Pyramimonas_sp.AAC.1
MANAMASLPRCVDPLLMAIATLTRPRTRYGHHRHLRVSEDSRPFSPTAGFAGPADKSVRLLLNSSTEPMQ